MEDLVQLMWNRFLQVADTMLDALEKGVDYLRLQAELREQLDAVGRRVGPRSLDSYSLIGVGVTVFLRIAS